MEEPKKRNFWKVLFFVFLVILILLCGAFCYHTNMTKTGWQWRPGRLVIIRQGCEEKDAVKAEATTEPTIEPTAKSTVKPTETPVAGAVEMNTPIVLPIITLDPSWEIDYPILDLVD